MAAEFVCDAAGMREGLCVLRGDERERERVCVLHGANESESMHSPPGEMYVRLGALLKERRAFRSLSSKFQAIEWISCECANRSIRVLVAGARQLYPRRRCCFPRSFLNKSCSFEFLFASCKHKIGLASPQSKVGFVRVRAKALSLLNPRIYSRAHFSWIQGCFGARER